jgi:hypothetical protein
MSSQEWPGIKQKIYISFKNGFHFRTRSANLDAPHLPEKPNLSNPFQELQEDV